MLGPIVLEPVKGAEEQEFHLVGDASEGVGLLFLGVGDEGGEVDYGKETVETEFGGLLNAFRYGAPPHAGCALGIDRIVMLLAGRENIREVTMFPKNQQAEDLLLDAPARPAKHS